MDEIKMEQTGDNAVQIGAISGDNNSINIYSYSSNTPINTENTNEDDSLLPSDDPVEVLLGESEKKAASGNYAEALDISQQALSTAKEVDAADELYTLRIACAKLACVLRMRQFPKYYSTAVGYISDIFTLKVFDKLPKKMFMLYFNLADISAMNNDLSTARAAIENAFPLAKDDYDNIRCNQVLGQIAMGEGKHDEAVAMFQKIVDIISLKITTKAYKDDGECYMLEQNFTATLNNIAMAY